MFKGSAPGADVKNKFWCCLTTHYSEILLWLDVASNVTKFNQLDCFIYAQRYYAKICLSHRLLDTVASHIRKLWTMNTFCHSSLFATFAETGNRTTPKTSLPHQPLICFHKLQPYFGLSSWVLNCNFVIHFGPMSIDKNLLLTNDQS